MIGLETVNEQLDAFLGDFRTMNLDSMQIAEKLVAYLKNDPFNLELIQSAMSADTIIKMYHSGNLIEIEHFFKDQQTGQVYSGFHDRVLIKRNDIMFNRTKERVAKENIFIAVGSGHLIGSNGLIAQYKNLGYTVRPMNVLSKSKEKIIWGTQSTQDFQVDLPKGVELKLDNDNYYFSSLSILGDSTQTFHTLYTPKGELSFTVRFEEEYLVEDAVEAVDDVEYEIEDAVLEAADDTVETIEEEEEEEVEEYIIEEEDMEIEEYDYDAGASKEDEMIYPPRRKPRLFEDSAQNAYLEEIGDSVKGYMKEFSLIMMASVLKGSQVAPIDTVWSVKSPTGSIDVNFRSSSFTSSLTRIIETNAGSYTLKLTGDKNMLLDPQYLRFFTHFKPLD